MKLEWFENILGYLFGSLLFFCELHVLVTVVHSCFYSGYSCCSEFDWKSILKKMRFEARLKLKNTGSIHFTPSSHFICVVVQLLMPLHVRALVKPNYKFVSHKFFCSEQITVEWRMLLGIQLWEIFALKLKRNSVFFPSPLIPLFVILQKNWFF